MRPNRSPQLRWERAAEEHALELIQITIIIETHAEQILAVLKAGTVSIDVHLRNLHNLRLDLGWLPVSVLPKLQWPKAQFKTKRAVTLGEHGDILAHETNPERRAFDELAWYLGAFHSYRDAWAERAKQSSYPARFAHEALGTTARRYIRIIACVLRSIAGED